MFRNIRRRWALALATLLAVLGGVFVAASPAQALPSTCTPSGSWTTAGSPAWGQMRWCWVYDYNDDTLGVTFQVQDILTDGWAVHLEIGQNNCSGGTCWESDYWAGRPSGGSACNSSGSVSTCYRPYGYFGPSYTPGSCSCYQLTVRLVKGSASASHPAYGATWYYFYA